MLSLFDGCFSLSVGLLMSRASWPVFETPLVCQNGKLLTCKLWAIVADYYFRNTLSGKMTLEFPYHSAGFLLGGLSPKSWRSSRQQSGNHCHQLCRDQFQSSAMGIQ